MQPQLEAIGYLAIAADVLQVPSDEIHHIADLADVESALAAPLAGFGGVAFYPEPYERAAILCSRLIRNHPLPDGNKRSAWIAMRMSSRSTVCRSRCRTLMRWSSS